MEGLPQELRVLHGPFYLLPQCVAWEWLLRLGPHTHEHCSPCEWRARAFTAKSEVTRSPEMHGPVEGKDHSSIWPGGESSGSSFVSALEVRSTEDA